MPYRRGGFALTPPSLVIFLISVVLALIALLVRYAHVSVPIISPARVFDVLGDRLCRAGYRRAVSAHLTERIRLAHFGDSIGTFDHDQFFQRAVVPDACR